MEGIMEKMSYYGTANGDVSRYTKKGVEHYNAETREFVPAPDETIFDIETSMKAITAEEAETIMERSSAHADKMATAG